MPQQPKGKARNNPTTQPPSHFFCGPACHCGRSRLTSSPSSPLHLLTHTARLVIVAGPAFRPTSPIHFHPIFIPNHQSFPPLRPGLSLWQVPPPPYPPTSSSPSLPSFSLSGFHLLRHMTRLATVASLTLPPASPPHPPHRHTYFPHTHHSGPACHCGRSRQIPLLTFPASPPFWIHIFNTLSLLWPGLSLWQVPPPSSPLLTTSPPSITPICHSLLKARLVIVAGLA